ncbi:kinase-like protein [Neurospora crassa]|nr:kinase-like protein [Neurospora crassa]
MLGDQLGDNGRFRVVHKLGHGGYGTVWLCQDTLSPTPKWRAVKVMSAKASTSDCAELRAMEAFRNIDRLAAENAFRVSVPLEHFWIDGPNGRHLALVFVLCAANAKYLGTTYGHNRALIKDLCFQLAKSLEFIHSRGLCHGDLRPSNILFRLCDGADSLPEEALLKAFYNGGKPNTGRVISLEDRKPVTRASAPSIPEQLVGNVEIGFHSGLCAASFAITDYGVSYSILDPPKEGSTGIPLDYASPEDRFFQRELLGPPSDIWTLGCCINYLAADFTHFAQPLDGDDCDTHAAKLESLMGPMPDPFRAAYKEEHKKEPKLRCFNPQVAKSDETNEGELEPITEKPSTNPFEEREKEMAAKMAKTAQKGERTMSPGEAVFRRNLQRTIYLSQTQEEADDMKKQYELWHLQQDHNSKNTAHTLPLPYSEKRRNGDDDDDDDEYMELRLDNEEADQLFDLLMSIFKWHPKDRATIEQVLNHPWFEGRNRHAAKVPSPVTTKKSVVDGAFESVKSYLHVNATNRWAQGLS